MRVVVSFGLSAVPEGLLDLFNQGLSRVAHAARHGGYRDSAGVRVLNEQRVYEVTARCMVRYM
jgi:hypothetical protein